MALLLFTNCGYCLSSKAAFWGPWLCHSQNDDYCSDNWPLYDFRVGTSSAPDNDGYYTYAIEFRQKRSFHGDIGFSVKFSREPYMEADSIEDKSNFSEVTGLANVQTKYDKYDDQVAPFATVIAKVKFARYQSWKYESYDYSKKDYTVNASVTRTGTITQQTGYAWHWRSYPKSYTPKQYLENKRTSSHPEDDFSTYPPGGLGVIDVWYRGGRRPGDGMAEGDGIEYVISNPLNIPVTIRYTLAGVRHDVIIGPYDCADIYDSNAKELYVLSFEASNPTWKLTNLIGTGRACSDGTNGITETTATEYEKTCYRISTDRVKTIIGDNFRGPTNASLCNALVFNSTTLDAKGAPTSHKIFNDFNQKIQVNFELAGLGISDSKKQSCSIEPFGTYEISSIGELNSLNILGIHPDTEPESTNPAHIKSFLDNFQHN